MNKYQNTIVVLLCLILLIQTASAAFDIKNPGTSFARDAFNSILTSQTDNLYEIFGMNSTSSTTAFVNFIIEPTDVISNPFVQKQKDYTAYWYFVFYVMFILIGAIKVMHESATEPKGFGIEVESWQNKYITIAVSALFIYAMYLYSINWFFSLEYALSKGTFLQTMDLMSAASQNATAYFIFGLLKLFLIAFMYIRYLILGLIVAFFLFIVAACNMPYTEKFGKMLISYGLLMLFSRFIITLIVFAGIGILQSWTALITLAPLVYFLPILVAVGFGIGCILYPIIYMFFRSPIKYIKVLK